MKGFELTLFEKLFDDSPMEPVRRSLSVDELKDSVARDLEALLNARTTIDETLADRYPESMKSPATYGLRDFAGMSLSNLNHRASICRSIELAIFRHEPRLKDVEVSLELDRRSVNALYFSIKAILVVRPAQEPVNFDALLQPTTLQYSVNRQNLRRGTI
ncbi:type VI secretion system baseplate subunit TssE [Aromatoleum diolicum]|uniref:Type VI secretion system baseplate subunit TssE n=1 Tax=Aromatoleum diolicum TaxID=75796 RepID=A0ABX1QIS2_9RHOO|nr:type VI secretion system baseplate subunit TssE [Aromatoleum diolicum]